MYFLTAPLFGAKHLLGLLFIALFYAILMVVINQKKTLNPKRVVLFITIIFFIMEILKLVYIIVVNQAFPIHHLPFHLCSLPLYLYPLMLLLKKGRFLERVVKPTAYAVVMLAGIMALLIPTNIIGENIYWFPINQNILPIISFFYHGLMIASSLYLMTSGFYRFQKSDYINALFATLSFATVAMIVNLLLNTDFMLLNRGAGSPLQLIIESSYALYLFAMIGLGSVLISSVFIVTHLLHYEKKEKAKIL